MALFDADSLRVEQTGRRSSNALRVLGALRQRPLQTLTNLSATLGISFPTVSTTMQMLQDLGIVVELTGQQRNRVFVYDSYMSILNEDGQPL